MIRARIGSNTRTIQTMKVRTSSGVKAVAFGSARIASGVKRFFTQSGSLSVSADPAYVSGATALAGLATISTNSTTAAPTGGASPYTYAWTKISDDGGTWTIQNPTSATTKFNCAGVGADIDFNATFRCTATDAYGGTGTVDVLATVSNYGGIYL